MGEVGPEGKAPPVEIGTMSGPLVSSSSPFPYGRLGRKVLLATIDGLHVILRVLCLVTSVAGLCLMVTAKQSSTVSIYGFQLPVYSKWSLADSFEYLVGVSGAVVAHSLLQLLISLSRLRRKTTVIPSQSYAWVVYAGDQEGICIWNDECGLCSIGGDQPEPDRNQALSSPKLLQALAYLLSPSWCLHRFHLPQLLPAWHFSSPRCNLADLLLNSLTFL